MICTQTHYDVALYDICPQFTLFLYKNNVYNYHFDEILNSS